MADVVKGCFPQAELSLCQWHLRHALERLMKKLRTAGEDRAVIDDLLPQVEAAFAGMSFWVAFVKRAHAASIPRLSEWLNTTGRIVEEQFRRRGPRTSRALDTPLSTSPMDAFIHPIRDAIAPRAYALKNRERTNRMLMLMQLHANRQDNERTYVSHIRQCLEASHGRPTLARRAVADPDRMPSLR